MAHRVVQILDPGRQVRALGIREAQHDTAKAVQADRKQMLIPPEHRAGSKVQPGRKIQPRRKGRGERAVIDKPVINRVIDVEQSLPRDKTDGIRSPDDGNGNNKVGIDGTFQNGGNGFRGQETRVKLGSPVSRPTDEPLRPVVNFNGDVGTGMGDERPEEVGRRHRQRVPQRLPHFFQPSDPFGRINCLPEVLLEARLDIVRNPLFIAARNRRPGPPDVLRVEMIKREYRNGYNEKNACDDDPGFESGKSGEKGFPIKRHSTSEHTELRNHPSIFGFFQRNVHLENFRVAPVKEPSSAGRIWSGLLFAHRAELETERPLLLEIIFQNVRSLVLAEISSFPAG